MLVVRRCVLRLEVSGERVCGDMVVLGGRHCGVLGVVRRDERWVACACVCEERFERARVAGARRAFRACASRHGRARAQT